MAEEVIFIFAVYITRKKQRILCGIGAAALVLGGVLLVSGQITDIPSASAVFGHSLSLKDADDRQNRIDFLADLGWQVDSETAEVRDVVIPLEFDEVYQNYNRLQQEQGFDLTPYAGSQMKCYSYTILNHPVGHQNIRANLLVYKGKLVGGDVCSLKLDGFMHGLQMPQLSEQAA